MKMVFINPERCIGCTEFKTAYSVKHSKVGNIRQAAFSRAGVW